MGKILKRHLCCAFGTIVYASPDIAFTFNSQVPTVARVGLPYRFQLSPSTFAPEATNFTYSLSNQPAWLAIDSASPSLSGTPSATDTGASTFTLTAADDSGAAHMPCTMIVSSDPAPRLEGDISKQLAASANLSSSDPPMLTLVPSSTFHFEFQPNSFIDIVQRKLYYYAILNDHTPLPAWMQFNPQTLTFSGTAPDLSSFPQSWSVQMIASDVAGFAGTTAEFAIVIARQQLVFVPEVQSVNISAGTQIRFTALLDHLFLNGAKVDPRSLTSAHASLLPNWMSFDPSTLILSGTVPQGANNTSIEVAVQDHLGDFASVVVNLNTGNASLFVGPIGSLTATAGQLFSYHFPDSLFSQEGLELSVDLPAIATWLSFDRASRKLQGTAPTATGPGSVRGTLIAKSTSPPLVQSEVFHIGLRTAPSSVSNNNSNSATPPLSTSTAKVGPATTDAPNPTPSALSGPSRTRIGGGIVAAIVILLFIALLAVCMLCHLRRGRRLGFHRHAQSPKKRIISRPVLQPEGEVITVSTALQMDVEKHAESTAVEPVAQEDDRAPQIALTLPRKSKWSNRFSHISQASSLGVGEDAIKADSNIPELGQESVVLHAPHDSFSVPAEMARVSRQLSTPSPTKRALKRLRDHDKSRTSVGLGIDTDGAGQVPRQNSRQHRSKRSSHAHSVGMERCSQASLSTRGTSVLSTRPSDFPRPPTRSSRSFQMMSMDEVDKRKSIRMVTRSDSIADDRPLQEKRQSFIRNRASTSWQSPLFAHGSRASVNGNTKYSQGSSIGSIRGSRHSKNMLATYSQSSSLEPPGHDSRRFSTRVRSTFAPNFPRAITRSSLGADDEGRNGDESDYYTTSSSISDCDFAAELALPRHQRSWVLPGEASPTPPPAPPTSRQPSSARRIAPIRVGSAARQTRKGSLPDGSGSVRRKALDHPIKKQSPPSGQRKAGVGPRSRLSDPQSLVSTDSVNRARKERPRLVHTTSERPVSVEAVKRLSSLRADAGSGTDTRGGSEYWEDVEGSGLMPPAALHGSRANTQRSDAGDRKFGKHIQKCQLDIPEYAVSYVDYKALKKLIKQLSATSVLQAHEASAGANPPQDPQAALQANKAAFFFRLERELEKVNTFYLQKEAELNLRLRTLLDKKRALQSRTTPASKLSSSYVTLDEGFRLFGSDLDKLQQFVEINQTAFSKILKKWDKTSKSRTKELYLSRAVDVQPCFNRDIISDLSDQATTGLLELQAWAEGEKISYTPAVELEHRMQPSGQDDTEVETQVLQAVNTGNIALVRDWASRTMASDDAKERISRVFLDTVDTANPTAQQVLYETNLIDYNYADQINERNCIHDAAAHGKIEVLRAALSHNAKIVAPDVYGRIPLHYACMHGHLEAIRILAGEAPQTIDFKDLDNFTPLIHGIVHSQVNSVQAMLQLGAVVNPASSADHIPLNLACQYGSVPIVEEILHYRPQMLPDAEGLFPQHTVARFGGATHILVIFKAYGVDMDQPDKLYAWTPLFHAASEGHLHCLKQLLEFGVNVNAVDEKELSAMYYAAWEGHLDCMKLLAQAGASTSQIPARDAMELQMGTGPPLLSSDTLMNSQSDAENIPSLSLPPPIIPLRRYGHNFLDTTKTFILLSFDGLESGAIEFYGDSKYPAARLTVSSKSSDLIPRNIPLPVEDDFKNISFQIENLDTFSIDFDIFPTFGSKVIARAAASSRVFTGKVSSSGQWHLELFDPRLRAIGRISFRFQVVTPFPGIPLEVTHFATYWKSTSQFDNRPSNLITGSSLSGDFMRLFVQVTRDGTPVLYNDWALSSSKNDLVSRLTYQEFSDAGLEAGSGRAILHGRVGSGIDREHLANAQRHIARSYSSLADVLAVLPPEINLDIHVCYPSRAEEEALHLGPTQNINVVVDAVLKTVFDHARRLRETRDAPLRSFVFSSYNADVCIALNWKQPNYPVLLCNDLGFSDTHAPSQHSGEGMSTNHGIVSSCGRTSISIKESVRIAQSNNFMGLVCTSRLLDLVPALVANIKEAGLVLIADYSHDFGKSGPSVLDLPAGVDGLLMDNAVLRFKEAIDQ